ncbi:uncharacterized protein NPIL_3221, partial [Nephila pilipes]
MHPTSRKKLVMSELNKRNIRKRRLIWKQFKTAIFIVCVACFSWQSANFFELYFTYPTTTNIDITYPEVLIKPAATLCNTNPVKRSMFCDKYPYLCQKPSNLTEFCKKHSHFCEGGTSKLMIPKLEYYANDSTEEARNVLREIYIHDIIKDGAEHWSWEKPSIVGLW